MDKVEVNNLLCKQSMNLKVGKKRDNSSIYPVFPCEFQFNEENTLER